MITLNSSYMNAVGATKEDLSAAVFQADTAKSVSAVNGKSYSESDSQSSNSNNGFSSGSGYRSMIDFMEISLSGLYRAIQEYSDKDLESADQSSVLSVSKSMSAIGESDGAIEESKKSIKEDADSSLLAQSNISAANALYLLS